jgi:predicted TIM-barrel fold metal-dependent hydrolase
MVAYSKFRQDTWKPEAPPPPGSCDCQVHVFGDPTKYPLRTGGAYAPPSDATIDAATRMHHTLGLNHGVVVQASVHGTNHTILLDALAKAGRRYRGIAIIDDAVSDEELGRLHDAGVRGARFNFWKQLNIAPTPAGFLCQVDRIKEYGWHAKVHCAGEEWLELRELLAKVKIPVVIDHMGHPDLKRGLDQPMVRVLLDLLKSENWWVTISNADRFSAAEHGWGDALPLAQRFIEAAPDRAIWCTDWPHVQYTKPMPNDAELLDFLCRAAPDAEQRRKILAANPARLFGLSDPPAWGRQASEVKHEHTR